MNIIEAAASMKPFKRNPWTNWIFPPFKTIMSELEVPEYKLTITDILADDWEVKE